MAAKSESVRSSESAAESLLARIFQKSGWKVEHRAGTGPDDAIDLLVRQKGVAYAIELKAAPEGRSDRLVPLLAQAILQARRDASARVRPLAVVAAPRIPERVADHLVRFAQDYGEGVAVGVIDFEGLSRFRGAQLEALDAQPPRMRPAAAPPLRRDSGQLFSDLNQWMLKVLLAPEIPDALLTAPRGSYRSASELARAANASVMSAFRFLRQLEREGYLHEAAPHLTVVRREHLFGRWQVIAAGTVRESPMKFVLRGDAKSQLRKLLADQPACLALFAAAEALGSGHVDGVPPYVYVERLQAASLSAWKTLRPCALGEAPDVIVRQAPAPQSVFRGMVRAKGVLSCDILQVWLDMAAHPARGAEQADLIRRRFLRTVIAAKS
jgi:hypothetical protein